MAGSNQWTARAVSISTVITSGKTWFGGFVLQTKGRSTPSSFVLMDTSTGSVRWAYGKVKSGTATGGAVGTVGDSDFGMLKRPILFGSGLYISCGAAALKSCIATVIYKPA